VLRPDQEVAAYPCRHSLTVCKADQNPSAGFIGTVTDGTITSAQYELIDQGEDKKTMTIKSRGYQISIKQVFKGVKGTQLRFIRDLEIWFGCHTSEGKSYEICLG
jgi:hypothetical protein